MKLPRQEYNPAPLTTTDWIAALFIACVVVFFVALFTIGWAVTP